MMKVRFILYCVALYSSFSVRVLVINLLPGMMTMKCFGIMMLEPDLLDTLFAEYLFKTENSAIWWLDTLLKNMIINQSIIM